MQQTKKKSLKIPLVLTIIDAIGGLLLGLGLAAHFSDIHLVPEKLRIENYDLIMIIVGCVLFLPLLIYMFNHFFGRKARNI